MATTTTTTSSITLADIQTRDITADEIKSMVTVYETVRGGAVQDIAGLDNKTVYDKFWYFIHAFSRLEIPGLDASKTAITLAHRVTQDKKYAVELSFTDGSKSMDVRWSGKHVTVTSNLGIAANGSWRDEVRPLFKTLKSVKNAEKREAKKSEKTEKVLKKAAAPTKKAKAKTAKDVEKTVAEKKATTKKASKSTEKDVLDELNNIVGTDKPVDQIDEMVANGEPLPF